jgi:hypothetical protein
MKKAKVKDAMKLKNGMLFLILLVLGLLGGILYWFVLAAN